MTEQQQIEIPFSKTKMLKTIYSAIVFVGIGLWFLLSPPKISNPFFGNATVISIVGVVSIFFFGLILITMIRKVRDKNAGLIINNQGVIDNSSGVSAGLVTWADIQEIKVTKVMNQKFLMFIVKNPKEYIDRVKNPLKRKGMEMNYRSYGSPISISANSLQTNFDNLYTLLTEKIKEYKP